MAQEEKQLLLIDLCARLPYGVKMSVIEPERNEFTNQLSYENGRTLTGILYAIFPNEDRVIVDELDKPITSQNVRCGGFNIENYNIKPYLRPMSSMTEEEENEFISLNAVPSPCQLPNHTRMSWYSNATMLDWLNEHRFDYRGLIEKGLALEAPEGMYKTE